MASGTPLEGPVPGWKPAKWNDRFATMKPLDTLHELVDLVGVWQETEAVSALEASQMRQMIACMSGQQSLLLAAALAAQADTLAGQTAFVAIVRTLVHSQDEAPPPPHARAEGASSLATITEAPTLLSPLGGGFYSN